MLADAYHAFASHFASRLHPLQFGQGGRDTRAKTGNRSSTPAAESQNLHTQGPSAAPQSSSWAAQMGQRLSEKHDRVEDADHARTMQRSGDLLQSIRNTAAAHRAAAPLPEERHQDSMSRSGDLLNRIREEQARSDASAPSTSGRTLRAPAPTTAPKAPAPTTAPMHSPGGVGKGSQWGLFSPNEAGTRVKAVRTPVEQPVEPGPGKGQLSLWSDKPAATPKATAPAAKRSAAKTTPAAPKSPSGPPAPKVTDAELDAMVDSWTSKRPAKSKGDLGPGYTMGRKAPNPPSMPAKGSVPAPAAASSSGSNVRETKVKVHGVERTVRTEHSGTPKQLETAHTKRVKDAINELHVAHRGTAIRQAVHELDSAKRTGVRVSEAKSNLSRLQSDQFATPVASQDIKKMVKPPAKRAYGKPGQLDVFKGDGPDDPKRSHNYGL